MRTLVRGSRRGIAAALVVTALWSVTLGGRVARAQAEADPEHYTSLISSALEEYDLGHFQEAMYQQRSGRAVFTFGELTLPAGAGLKLIGTLPVVLASVGAINVNGVIDARPMDAAGTVCADLTAGPGGSVGGEGGNACACPSAVYVGKPGAGAGGGQPSANTTPVAGGGGAGHAAAGGGGGPTAAGAGGAMYSAAADELVGGSGGAGGGNWSDNGRAPRGGGGGGAVQLISATSIAIGNGATPGGINAAGCGGSGTPPGALAAAGAGGGGGSGGTIWIEAPVVQLGPKAVLAANGGGGSAAEGPGSPGALSAEPANGWRPNSAPPGNTCTTLVWGGCGGAGDSIAGVAGSFKAAMSNPFSPQIGYGGGGSAGRVYVAAAADGLTRSASAVVSPSVASGAATLATIDLQ